MAYEDPYGQSNTFLTGKDKPPIPDDVAPRGTPEWRAAFNAEQDWLNGQVAAGGGAGDATKAAQILGNLGYQNKEGWGKANFTRIGEIAGNAQTMGQDAMNRQRWIGGAGGRPLSLEELASLQSATGWTGGAKGIPFEYLQRWGGLGGRGMGGGFNPDGTKNAFDPTGGGFHPGAQGMPTVTKNMAPTWVQPIQPGGGGGAPITPSLYGRPRRRGLQGLAMGGTRDAFDPLGPQG